MYKDLPSLLLYFNFTATYLHFIFQFSRRIMYTGRKCSKVEVWLQTPEFQQYSSLQLRFNWLYRSTPPYSALQSPGHWMIWSNICQTWLGNGICEFTGADTVGTVLAQDQASQPLSMAGGWLHEVPPLSGNLFATGHCCGKKCQLFT